MKNPILLLVAFSSLALPARAADPAVPVVADLIAGEGPMTLRLVIDTALHGPNRKVSNLVNLAKVASGDIIVLADSDMRVSPG